MIKTKISLPDYPICKSNLFTKIKKSFEKNGLFGPGHNSWVVDFLFYCELHGIIFKDVRKVASDNCLDYEEND